MYRLGLDAQKYVLCAIDEIYSSSWPSGAALAFPGRPVSTGGMWAVGKMCVLLRNPALWGRCLPGSLTDPLIVGELFYREKAGFCGELIATQTNSCLQICKSCPGHRASIHFSSCGRSWFCLYLHIHFNIPRPHLAVTAAWFPHWWEKWMKSLAQVYFLSAGESWCHSCLKYPFSKSEVQPEPMCFTLDSFRDDCHQVRLRGEL